MNQEANVSEYVTFFYISHNRRQPRHYLEQIMKDNPRLSESEYVTFFYISHNRFKLSESEEGRELLSSLLTQEAQISEDLQNPPRSIKNHR